MKIKELWKGYKKGLMFFNKDWYIYLNSGRAQVFLENDFDPTRVEIFIFRKWFQKG